MPNPFLQMTQLERLRRDRTEMEALREESSILSFETQGDPQAPSHYLITFHGRGIEGDAPGAAALKDVHQVEILIGEDYPQRPPQITWKTPLLHPNVTSVGRTCLDLFTMGPGVRLVDLVELLWDIARLAVFNLAHSDIEAWNDARRAIGFPVDERALRDRMLRKDPVAMGAAEDPRGLEWKRRAIEQYLQSRELSHDSHVYTQEEWRARGEKYGNEAPLTITTEGPLYALLNRGDWETAADELADFNRFLESLGLYYELGYAWTVHLYPTERT
jgi:ubiquitin-protein ligase